MTAALESALPHLERFGLSAFRPGQDDVIRAVLEGRDCLCIMPTGGGKSLCYQLPAVMREGVTLVVSPLIALMKDQVDALSERGLSATFINSTLGPAEQRLRMEQMQAGEYDLVYIAPERLRQAAFVSAVLKSDLSLLAIDEAHCISEWGHDFRPDYARLGDFREKIGSPQTIALTATATRAVRADVVKQLRIETPETFVTGFGRPNLRFEVEVIGANREKDLAVTRLLRETNGPAIIYAATRKKCEALCEMIRDELQQAAGVYHAGLSPDERQQMQEAFMGGDLDVIVATNAFGMGVDKSDLRLVAHYNMPGSLEAYYQEAGRAGRDGEASRCVLLFSYADRMIQDFFIENNYPDEPTVAKVYDFLRSQRTDPIELTQQEIREQLQLKIGAEGVGAAIRILDRSAGAIRRLDSNEKHASFWINGEGTTLAELLPREAKVQRKVLRAVERIVGEHRYEQVPIRLEYLQSQTDLEREPLNRALRELLKLPQFDYVPPFRGRALHVVDREMRFADLEIDFDELAAHKRAEQDKLDRVVAYAYGSGCRQGFILDYFGDKSGSKCGVCDQCSQTGVAASPDRIRVSNTPRLTEVVRKVLSGVARAKERFGKNIVALMLCGSKSSKISKFGLDRLSTFGLLSQLTQKDVSRLIDELVSNDLLAQSDVDRFRPIVKLTALGRNVMLGVAEPPDSMWLPIDLLAKLGIRARASGDQVANPDPWLREKLLAWRNETAEMLGFPPYTVLHNATVDRIASQKPSTLEALAEIKGVGPQCISNWGQAILDVMSASSQVERETPSAPAAGDLFSPPVAQPGSDASEVGNRGDSTKADQESISIEEQSSQDQSVKESANETPKKQDSADELWSFDFGLAEESGGANRADSESGRMELTSSAEFSPSAASPAETLLGEETEPKDGTPEDCEAYWTWRLIEAGFSESDCCRIRGLSLAVVRGHLAQAEESDWS